MAWGRKKSGGRKEPQFGLAASLAELRLGPQDRVGRRRRQAEEEAIAQTARPAIPATKRRASASRVRAEEERQAQIAKARARSGLGRLVYWGAVLGLWAVIAVVGVVIWVGAHLPAIQSLEIPKRPPTIQIVGPRRQRAGVARRNGRRQCRAEGSAAASAARRSSPSRTAASIRISASTRSASRARRSPTSCTAASRRAARR